MKYLTQSLWALFATCGSAFLFRVPTAEIFFASLGGSIGWVVFLLVNSNAHSETVASLVAAMAVGFYAEIMAVLRKKPATLYSTCAIIPLVPGAGMFYTMLEAVQGSAEKAWNTGFAALSVAGAIAAGLALVASLTRILNLNTGRIGKSKVH